MIQFDYILFFKWVLQPLEPPPSSNPLCPGLPWIHRTRLCRGIHPTVWHRRPAAPYGHHHPRNRQWSQHRGPSILSYCDTWPFEKSDFQFWIPRLDTSISFFLKTKLSPWKNRTRATGCICEKSWIPRGPMLVCLALGPKMADMALWDWTKSTLESLLPSVAHWLQLHAWQWMVIYKSQRWAQHPWWIDLTWRPFRIRWLEL